MHLFSTHTAKKRRRNRSDSGDFSSTTVADDEQDSLTQKQQHQQEQASTIGNTNNNNNDNNSSSIITKGAKNDNNELLPVHAYKREILQFLHNNNKNKVLLITADTGSGKSTQIPTYLLNTKHKIAVTQPRRVAAITLAHRVVNVMKNNNSNNEKQIIIGKQIGYRVRFDDCTCYDTQLVYVTDGMLLREAMMDPLLNRYSIIFLDEAHERSIQTDILMGVVYRARIRRRYKRPLQVVIMSATLQIDTFIKFFGNDNIHHIHIPGRQYPVQILYTEHVQDDYIEAALSTIIQIHEHEKTITSNEDEKNLHVNNKSDILVFLPGQEEIEDLANLLKLHLATYEQDKSTTTTTVDSIWKGDRVEVLNTQQSSANNNSNLVAGVLICVLYAALPPEQQLIAFQEDKPPGCYRKIILCTNIAETSVTIPNIRYVVDTGKYKTRYVSTSTGMESLQIDNISQAQALQRTGRAGRVQAGYCFRLYTEDAYNNNLPVVNIPEILRINLSQIILQLKGMGIKDPLSFEFITSPDKKSLIRSMKQLYALNALDNDMQLTVYGKQLAKLPLDPIFGHLLLQSNKYNCVKEILTVVSVLSADNLFYRPVSAAAATTDDGGGGIIASQAAAAHRRFTSHEGDLPTYLNVYNAWQKEAIYIPPSSGGRKAQKKLLQQQQQSKKTNGRQRILHGDWCIKNYISGRALARAYDVRIQLQIICGRSVEDHGLGMDINSTSSDDYERFLKCIAAGLFLQAASRVKVENNNNNNRNNGKGRSGLVTSSTRGRYRTIVGNELVSIHPTSALFNRQPAPKCVVYTELVITKKTYIRGVTQIREEWLSTVAPQYYS